MLTFSFRTLNLQPMDAKPPQLFSRIPPLARLRILKGLTQEQLAAAAHLDRGVLSRIERGLVPLRPPRLPRIAQALDLTADELLVRLQELT